MAWTARNDDEKKEFFDSPEELERKVSQLAEWVRSSKHMIVFTVSYWPAAVSLSKLWPDRLSCLIGCIDNFGHLFPTSPSFSVATLQGAGVSTSAGSTWAASPDMSCIVSAPPKFCIVSHACQTFHSAKGKEKSGNLPIPF